MDNAERTDTCAHPPCDCPAPSAGEYCSEHCRNAAGTETECRCGHPDCG
jgi:hypothetical protein